MIPAALVVLATLALLAYVSAPLRRSAGRDLLETEGAHDEAEADKRVALISLVELEQDRDAGKVDEHDYEELKSEYEVEAVAALRRLDQVEGSTSDDDLESEIARIRTQLRCPTCGAPRGAGPRCARCGA